MKKIYISLILSSIILVLTTGCSPLQKSNVKSQETNYFRLIKNNQTTEKLGNNFKHSFYYDISDNCKFQLELELSIKHNGKEYKKVILKSIKKDIGDIDGNFSISLLRIKEENKLIWTVKEGGNIKQITTPDFIKDTDSFTGSSANEGSITSQKNTFFSRFYGKNVIDENYEWEIRLDVSSKEIFD